MVALKPLIITPGDPDGIGPEVTAKALARLPKSFLDSRQITIVGASRPFAKLKISKRFSFIEAPENSNPGAQAGWSIETAANLILAGEGRALITGPIHKARLQAGGYKFSGHTDFLAALAKVPEVTMMLANDKLRASLVTTHLALNDVSSHITARSLERATSQTFKFLTEGFKISQPRIALCSLNPHAGEEGLFGQEERLTIAPFISNWNAMNPTLSVFGPFPSDTFFALNQASKKPYDAVIAMYHDQGLIPVKLLDFPHTVNITLGLPFVRTSVDHGTAFDIAGKGIADHRSMLAAIRWADRLSKGN